MSLTNSELERLAMLSEEAAEIIKNVNKTIRHGYASYNPDGDVTKTNRVLLEEEIGDFLGIVDQMVQVGDLSRSNIDNSRFNKWRRSKKYTHFQE
jgi:predicted house-cleaning noncanonical NTP pyrophosphatase (MazG superfamily)